MLARLLLAGALGTGIITLPSGANAKSADNASVMLTWIDRTGNGHSEARADGVRLAWDGDREHDRDPWRDHRRRCFDPDHDGDCDHKHHKHRSHHHHDD
jgi:hypothetical protein